MLETISLFFGSLLDATIGPNLFVPGEPFLLAAGYQLHQGVIWGVVLKDPLINHPTHSHFGKVAG